MEANSNDLDIDDPQLEEKLVGELKSQGIFDQIRKDCLADVDTTPAYQNLRKRVDQTLESFIKNKEWKPTLNKNQLRNQLKAEIQKISGKEMAVDKIVEQIVGPKINSALVPEIEKMIYKFFDAPKTEEKELSNGFKHMDMKEDEEDVEMADAPASGGSSPGIGLAGQISPITPSREEGRKSTSPVVNAGDISPITPSTTPPHPSSTTAAPPPPADQMEVEEAGGTPPPRPLSAYTPPPLPEISYTPPPRVAPLDDIFVPPPLPPTAAPFQRSPAAMGSHTPPLPPPAGSSLGRPQDAASGEEGSMSGISDVSDVDISPPRVSPRSPPEHSPSAEISLPAGPPPPPPVLQEASDVSDVSDTELVEEVVGQQSPALSASGRSTASPAAVAAAAAAAGGGGEGGAAVGNSSDSEMEQLVKMRAELMAKLEGDFKLSPEEESSSDSDSEPEDNESEKQKKEESPASPDESPAPPRDPEQSPPPPAFSPSDNNFSPPPPPPADGGGGDSPGGTNDGNQSAPSPPSGQSSPGEVEDQERGSTAGGQLEAASQPLVSSSPNSSDLASRHLSPEPETSQSGGVEYLAADQNKASSPPASVTLVCTPSEKSVSGSSGGTLKTAEVPVAACGFNSGETQSAGGVRQCVGPRTPEPAPPLSPEPVFSPVEEEEEPESRTPSPSPLPPQPTRRGPVTPPEPAEPSSYHHQYLERGPVTPPSPPSAFSGHHQRPPGWRPPSPKEAHPDTCPRPGSRPAPTLESISSTRVVQHKEKVEKKSDKIKEQQKAKLEKVEQKVKSKDKLKSDKFQDLDIFSTTKKPFTPHQPHRPPGASVGPSPAVSSPHPGGLKTPNGQKKMVKPNEFGLKLEASLKEHISRQEQEKAAAASSSSTPTGKTSSSRPDFAKPAKQPDRRPSTDTKARDSSSSSKLQRSDSSSNSKEATGEKSARDKERKTESSSSSSSSSRDKKKERDRDRHRDKDRDRDRDKEKSSKESSSSKDSSRDKSGAGGEGKSRHASGTADAKSRRSSVDETAVKSSGAELERKRAHESFMLEAKQRLQDRREKEELAERERRRQKEEARRRERRQQQQQQVKEEKDLLREKISSLDINEIKQLLTETMAAKVGVTLNHKDNKKIYSTLEEIIQQKKVRKDDQPQQQQPKKKTPPPSAKQEDAKATLRTSTETKVKEEKVIAVSSSSSSSSSDSDDEVVESSVKSKALPAKTPESLPKPAAGEEQRKAAAKRRPTLIASSSSDEDSEEEKEAVITKKQPARPEAAAAAKQVGEKRQQQPKQAAVSAKTEQRAAAVATVTTSPKKPAVAAAAANRDLKVRLNKLPAGKVPSYKEVSTDSDTDSDFEIQVETVEDKTADKAGSTSTAATSPNRLRPDQQKVTPVRGQPQKTALTPTPLPPPAAVSPNTPPRQAAAVVAATPSPPRPSPVDLDPGMGELAYFTPEEVDQMRRRKSDLDSIIDNEDNISVSSVSSDELDSYIPSSRHIEVDLPAGCNTQKLLEGIEQLGGGARILRPPPDWLVPYLKGAKLKPEDLTMPTRQEIADHLNHKEKKARKRAGGYDIVVEWVPAPAEGDASKRSRLEKGLEVDPFSAFSVAASQLAESGTKRTRRANGRYLSTEYQSQEEDTEEEREGGKGNKTLPTTTTTTTTTTTGTNLITTSEIKVTETSPDSKKKSSKERIKAYLRSAGVEREESEDRSTGDSVTATNPAASNPTPAVGPPTVDEAVKAPATADERQRRRDKPAAAAVVVAKVPEPAARPARRSVTSCDKSAVNGGPAAVGQEDRGRGNIDAELAATDSEMASIIQSLIEKRKNKKKLLQEEEEFHGWSEEEIRVPATFLSLLADQGEGLEGVGARFGMDRLDALGLSHLFDESSDGEEPQLEVVMSQAILKDIKKAEQHTLLHYRPQERRKSDLNRPVVSDLDLRNGSEGSDLDDRGSSSPGSFGSAKENLPSVRPKRNSLPPKFNQKEPGGESRPESRKRCAGQTPGVAPLQKRAKLSTL